MFNEQDHPRDNDGKFTEKGNKTSSLKEQRENVKQEIISLREKLRNTRTSMFGPPSKEREEINNKIKELEKWLDDTKTPINQPLGRTKIENNETKQDYMMSHRPTETGITADDLTNQNVESPMPKDMYEKWYNYFDKDDKSSVESIEALQKVRNNPNATITIYRATNGNSINDGDWVTLSENYAKEHNQHSLNNKGNIIKMKVPVKDIQYAGDSINEWGYFPKNQEKQQASKLFNIDL